MALKNNQIDHYIDVIGDHFKKLPELPKDVRDFLVLAVPWVALIGGIIGVAVTLVGFGVFTFLAPLAFLSGAGADAGQGILAVLLGLVASILMLMAFPGLSKHKATGWRYIFYSEVVYLLGQILSISLGGIVMALIGFYLLYQIRAYYK